MIACGIGDASAATPDQVISDMLTNIRENKFVKSELDEFESLLTAKLKENADYYNQYEDMHSNYLDLRMELSLLDKEADLLDRKITKHLPVINSEEYGATVSSSDEFSLGDPDSFDFEDPDTFDIPNAIFLTDASIMDLDFSGENISLRSVTENLRDRKGEQEKSSTLRKSL